MTDRHEVAVEFWFDPVCPYSWTASRWLHEVGKRRLLGEEVLADFYTAFGELVFDAARRRCAQDYPEVLEVALRQVGLPVLRAQAHRERPPVFT